MICNLGLVNQFPLSPMVSLSPIETSVVVKVNASAAVVACDEAFRVVRVSVVES